MWKKIALRVSIAAASLGGHAGTSSALVFGQDNRQLVSDVSNSAYAPIGIVYDLPAASYATAFLVSECYAVTVRHAFEPETALIGTRVKFAAGFSADLKGWETTDAQVVAMGRQVAADEPSGNSDWALLRLSRCLGKRFGFALLSDRPIDQSRPFELAGFPSDRRLSGGLTVDPQCHVREFRGELALHDCATQPGNSGSPIFRIVRVDGTDRLEVVAMNVQGFSYGVPGATLTQPVTKYYSSYAGVALTSVKLRKGVEEALNLSKN